MNSATQPALPPATLLYPLATIVEQLELAKLFPSVQPLHVELGAGDGGFIMDYARMHPHLNCLAVERLLGRARKIGRKGYRANLENLRVIRLEASYVLKYLLPRAAAEALHIYFPDPWPKRRHWKRRLINPEFTAVAASSLAPGGSIYIRTDNSGYFSDIIATFQANPRFQAIQTPPELRVLLTDFEKDFHAQGISTLYAAYQLAS